MLPVQSPSVEHALRIMITVVIVLATMLLGIGDRTIALTLATLVIAAVSAYVTDIRRLFHFSQPVSNFVALGVVVVSAINASSPSDRHLLMIAVASLQSYLQYVLLFQTKTPRIYWQLALL